MARTWAPSRRSARASSAAASVRTSAGRFRGKRGFAIVGLILAVHRILMVTACTACTADGYLPVARWGRPVPVSLVQLRVRGQFPLKRNTLVLSAVLFILAIFAWAGWANWEYRRQAAERALATAAQGELVPDPAGGMPQYISPLMGKPAPEFTLEDLSGKKVSLASYKGKAVLINFWATWCAPCKIETPWLIELRNKYAAQGFEVLGISTEGDDLKRATRRGGPRTRRRSRKFVARRARAVSGADGRRQSERCLWRTGFDADIVFCGSQGRWLWPRRWG